MGSFSKQETIRTNHGGSFCGDVAIDEMTFFSFFFLREEILWSPT